MYCRGYFDNEYDAIRNPEKLEKTLRGIKSTYGVYACWGNHDLNEEILAGFTFKHKDGDLSDIKDPRMKNFLKIPIFIYWKMNLF